MCACVYGNMLYCMCNNTEAHVGYSYDKCYHHTVQNQTSHDLSLLITWILNKVINAIRRLFSENKTDYKIKVTLYHVASFRVIFIHVNKITNFIIYSLTYSNTFPCFTYMSHITKKDINFCKTAV